MGIRSAARLGLAVSLLLAAACVGPKAPKIDVLNQQEIAKEAYIYAFPMLVAYKAMYEFNVDRASTLYKGPFNQIVHEARAFTPKDAPIVTPNVDTPYSMVQMDLRAEPIVLCMPEIAPERYYSVQLTDLYSYNYGYIGSRTTGNGAGCYLVSGPDWGGDKPAGIAKVFSSETQFSLAIYRTQLFDPSDLTGVKQVQAGYEVHTLSAFLEQAAPPPPPEPSFPKFSANAFHADFIAYLNFLLQFCPTLPAEAALRERFAAIGVAPGKGYALEALPPEERIGVGLGVKDGLRAIRKRRAELGRNLNGWRVVSDFGDRAFFHGDYLLRAAAARAGFYRSDAAEALYPMASTDNKGRKLDGSKHRYKITLPAGTYPPVNAFWSLTSYDARTRLLVENPIGRYQISSPMLPRLKKNWDGSLTIHLQKDSPNGDQAANWLPAPDGPILLVMRLYWPKQQALDGRWKPAPIVRVR